MVIGLRVEVKMDLQISILVGTITNVVKFLTVYFFKAVKSNFGFPLIQAQKGPCRRQHTTQKAFSNYGILHKYETPECRTGLSSSRKGDAIFLAVEDELFAPVFIVRQLYH